MVLAIAPILRIAPGSHKASGFFIQCVNNCMGKPSRTILASKFFELGSHGYEREDILRMDSTWAVVYDGCLISVRRQLTKPQGAFKYIKLMYPDRGRAIAMARQLNEDYKTNKFTVIRLEQLMTPIRAGDTEDLESADIKEPQRRRGRPTGQSVAPAHLMRRRIAVIEELKPENLGDLLD